METLVEAVRRNLADGFELDFFDAVIQDYRDSKSKLRVNNFALGIRELLNNVLRRLGPDADVRLCSWFKEDSGDVKYPTRAQRINYAVHGGMDGDFVNNELGVDVSESRECLVAHYNILSDYAHVTPKNLGINDKENSLAREVLSSMSTFFDQMDKCRSEVVYASEKHINNELLDTFFSETISEIDTLATHHWVEGVYVDSVLISCIDSSGVYFDVDGTIDVALQWGSDGDMRRGDGASQDISLPFKAKMSCPVSGFNNFTIIEPIDVVTDDWYGVGDE